MVELLPKIDVVTDDSFNSSPTDPQLMGPEAYLKYEAGDSLPSTTAQTPLVRFSSA